MKQRTAAPLQAYALPDVLFTGEQLVLNEEERIVSLPDGQGELAAQARLEKRAWAVTQAVLAAHPAPCPLAQLYAAYAGLAREDAREILRLLTEAGLLTPARARLEEALAACRAQLLAFQIGLVPVPEAEGSRLVCLALA